MREYDGNAGITPSQRNKKPTLRIGKKIRGDRSLVARDHVRRMDRGNRHFLR